MGFFDKIKKALIGETKEAEQEIDKPLVDADSPEAQRSEESQPAQTPAEQGASEPVAPAETADSSDLEAEQETAEVRNCRRTGEPYHRERYRTTLQPRRTGG